METEYRKFETDYAIAPGEILEEYLDAFSMKQKELSDRIGISPKHINEIVKGKAPLTPETALKLENVFQRPAHFWSNLEMNYQQDKARLKEQEKRIKHLEWLKKVPVTKMIQLGWIPKHKNKAWQLDAVLSFFGVSSPEQWSIVWERHQVIYRQSLRFETHPEAVSAWLRKGELEAAKISCAKYEPKKFHKMLKDILPLTMQSPDVFTKNLQQLCASAGVAVVFVPELPKTGVSGATRWLGNKPVIQLSLRYKTDDHLWFTFFHEAGHILKHGKKDIFIETTTIDGKKEDEANSFARDFLIPKHKYNEFLESRVNSPPQIKAFANELGIAPGIVVGRLQHDKKLAYSSCNRLKTRLEWSSPTT